MEGDAPDAVASAPDIEGAVDVARFDRVTATVGVWVRATPIRMVPSAPTGSFRKATAGRAAMAFLTASILRLPDRFRSTTVQRPRIQARAISTAMDWATTAMRIWIMMAFRTSWIRSHKGSEVFD